MRSFTRASRAPVAGAASRGRRLSALLALTLVVAACGGSGDDDGDGGEAGTDGTDSAQAAEEGESVRIRFNHIMGEGSFITDAVVAWAEEVEQETEGRVTFEHYYGSSLLAPPDLLSGFRDGRAEGIYYSAAYSPQESPLASIVTAAGVDENPDVQIRTMSELATSNKALQEEIAANNGTALWTAPLDPYVLASADPVETLDDLQGMRVRVPGGVAAVFEEYGSSTTFTSSEEVYEAVQRGVVDGVMFPWHLVVGSGVFEVAPHITGFPRQVNNAGTIVLRTDVLESLSQEDQDAIAEISRRYIDVSLDTLADAEAEACDAILESGGSARLLSDAEMDEFADAIGDAGLQTWRGDVIEMGVDEAEVDAFLDTYLETQERYQAEAAEYVHPAESCTG